MNITRNHGHNDGINSASFDKPIHNNWLRRENGTFIHDKPDYLKGYLAGWLEATGEKL